MSMNKATQSVSPQKKSCVLGTKSHTFSPRAIEALEKDLFKSVVILLYFYVTIQTYITFLLIGNGFLLQNCISVPDETHQLNHHNKMEIIIKGNFT